MLNSWKDSESQEYLWEKYKNLRLLFPNKYYFSFRYDLDIPGEDDFVGRVEGKRRLTKKGMRLHFRLWLDGVFDDLNITQVGSDMYTCHSGESWVGDIQVQHYSLFRLYARQWIISLPDDRSFCVCRRFVISDRGVNLVANGNAYKLQTGAEKNNKTKVFDDVVPENISFQEYLFVVLFFRCSIFALDGFSE